MKRTILFIFPSSVDAVRLQKFAQFFCQHNYTLEFIGWNRYPNKIYTDNKFSSIQFLIKGGGEGTRILPLLYIWFITKLFFVLLFKKGLNDKILFAINFESAFVLWCISKFRPIRYVYDIWDELAISHKFPSWVKTCIRFFDKKIRKASCFYIHVDENRVSDIDSENYIIIYNSPFDYIKNKQGKNSYNNSFAVTGWLNDTRGLKSILHFAEKNPLIKFIVVGEFINKETEKKYIEIPNIEYHHFMSQSDLFKIIGSCRGIFSLYDPTIEINKLAASNKLYDAMMLSIPVIVNEGILAADLVRNAGIGFVVNYDYNETWQVLETYDNTVIASMGQKGRNLYLQRYEFSKMLETVLLPALNNYTPNNKLNNIKRGGVNLPFNLGIEERRAA